MSKNIRGSLLFLAFGVLALGMTGLFSSKDATAQPGATDSNVEQRLEQRIKTFFGTLASSSGGMKNALEELFRDSSLPGRGSTELIDSMSQKFAELRDSGIGSYQGYEQIDCKWAGKDLIIMRYLHKGENYPVLWYFQFYRTLQTTAGGSPTSQWNIINVRFDTNLESVFFTPENRVRY